MSIKCTKGIIHHDVLPLKPDVITSNFRNINASRSEAICNCFGENVVNVVGLSSFTGLSL